MAEIYGFRIDVEGNAVKGITAIDQSLSGLNQKSESATGGIMRGFIGAQVAMQAFNAVVGAGKSIINFGIQTEQTRTAFDVMLGSVDKGREMFENLKHWADLTPFDNDTAYQAGRQLLNYGIAAKDILPYMNMLGDASGGVKERFDRMAYAFGQIKAAGKLQGQDLRQLIDAGFNPLQEMTTMTGKSMGELKKEMEKGGISFEMMVGAFKHATTEGGRFAGMMDKQSQTVGGLFSTVAGTAQTTMYGIFQKMSPMLKDIAKTSIDVAQSFGEWVTPKQSEILGGQRIQMMAMFEVLKNGNLPLDQRRELMNKINAEYKDYLPSVITEKTSISDLTKVQGLANIAMLEKIKIMAQQEVLAKYFKQASQAQEKMMEAQIQIEGLKQAGYKPGGGGILGLVLGTDASKADIAFATAQSSIASEQKKYDEAMKKLSLTQNMQLLAKTKGLNTTEESILGTLKEKSTALTTSKGNAFEKSALATSNMGASGGLGQAKVINMNFNQPLMQINADKLDRTDLSDNASKVVEQMARELHNIATEQGTM
jgi:tape measure domain-containing protein